jgi:hypothetical protein
VVPFGTSTGVSVSTSTDLQNLGRLANGGFACDSSHVEVIYFPTTKRLRAAVQSVAMASCASASGTRPEQTRRASTASSSSLRSAFQPSVVARGSGHKLRGS